MRVSISMVLILVVQTLSAQDSRNFTLLDHWYSSTHVPNGVTQWYNEAWGMVVNGQEYAVIGSQDGTHILRITDQNLFTNEIFVQGASTGAYIANRDYYQYGNYLYAVCDQGLSTFQIIDLSYLPDSVQVVYDQNTPINKAHTIWVDENKQKLYVCGAAGYAMRIFDVSDPVNPVWLYDHTNEGYIHDCYVRNDTAFLNAGPEGLFIYRFSWLPVAYLLGSYEFYPDQGYNHSGKPNKNMTRYVFTDETAGKRIKLVDLSDFTDIQLLSLMRSNGDANTIAHDPIWYGEDERFILVSYYYDGLLAFDVKDPAHPQLAGWYDTYEGNPFPYAGNWGVYALPSGRILASDCQNGLYLLDFNAPPDIHTDLEHGIYPNPANDQAYIWYNDPTAGNFDLMVFDAMGQKVFQKENIEGNFQELNTADWAAGPYVYRLKSTSNGIDVRGKFTVAH